MLLEGMWGGEERASPSSSLPGHGAWLTCDTSEPFGVGKSVCLDKRSWTLGP